MAFLLVDVVAGICAVSAIIVAVVHIFNHLRNYTEPTYQRYTVRIIFMVPVYAAMSFLSLLMPNKSIYFDSFRDIYEAWVIYNFLSLCLAWVGGPGAVVTSLAGRFLKPSWHLMTCCLPAIPWTGQLASFLRMKLSKSITVVTSGAYSIFLRFIRRCKQGCLQFVILKPLMVVATLSMYFKDSSSSSGSLYVTLIYTVSYTVALCALLLFYFACKELLRPFKPLPKFIMIKSVVFLTYWQGVLLGLMVTFGLIGSERESADLQNFLICIEMFAAAVGHLYAFPYREYAEANVGSSGGLLRSISHAMNFNDVVYDTMHQFAPTYHNYVLYSDGSQEAPTNYRARTFVKTGQEMETLRNNKNMGQSSKLEEGAYCSSLSSEGNSPVIGESVDEGRLTAKESSLSSTYGGGRFSSSHDISLIDAPSSLPHTASEYNGTAGLCPIDIGVDAPSDFNPRKEARVASERQQRSSGLDSRRRSSTGEDAFEETRLTERRRSSTGVLMDEIDYAGEEDAYHEGYVQQ